MQGRGCPTCARRSRGNSARRRCSGRARQPARSCRGPFSSSRLRPPSCRSRNRGRRGARSAPGPNPFRQRGGPGLEQGPPQGRRPKSAACAWRLLSSDHREDYSRARSVSHRTRELIPMKLSKVAMKRLMLLALAIACLVPAMPAAAQPERLSRTEALAALKKSDPAERRRGALGLAIVGRMEDGPTLIAALRDTDERVRTVAERALWAVWSRSGDVRVDDLFGKGVAQMGEQRFPEAIATFTRIIELKPGFAEGWNKRATAYFLAGEYRRSLKDCDEVIKRNPQHFGVLSGFGQIYLQLDQPEKALEYFRRALAVNPNLEGVQGLAERLDSMIARRREHSI